jgi:hypothetical protein
VPPANDAPSSLAHNQTFNYTGGQQTFQVPAGVKALAVVARGGGGALNEPAVSSAIHTLPCASEQIP